MLPGRRRGGGRSPERLSASCGGSANLSGQHPALPRAAEDGLSCSSTSGPRRLFFPRGAFPPPPPPPLAEPVAQWKRSDLFPPKRKGGQRKPCTLWVTAGWVPHAPGHGAHSIRGWGERESREVTRAEPAPLSASSQPHHNPALRSPWVRAQDPAPLLGAPRAGGGVLLHPLPSSGGGLSSMGAPATAPWGHTAPSSSTQLGGDTAPAELHPWKLGRGAGEGLGGPSTSAGQGPRSSRARGAGRSRCCRQGTAGSGTARSYGCKARYSPPGRENNLGTLNAAPWPISPVSLDGRAHSSFQRQQSPSASWEAWIHLSCPHPPKF